MRLLCSFTEANPDKGTETNHPQVHNKKYLLRLQKLTPIRGRKLFSGTWMRLLCSFTEANPDKGTETNHPQVHNKKYLLRLQKLTPIRGRKPYRKVRLDHLLSVYRS